MSDHPSDNAPLDETVSAIRDELGALRRMDEELSDQLAEAHPHPRILGSLLHDFYICCERVFRRISGEISGSTYGGDQWHKELLYRMTVDVPGVRPAVISEDLAAELDEYLAFRHVFRSIYGFELRGSRIGRLAQGMTDVSRRFTEELEAFLKAIS